MYAIDPDIPPKHSACCARGVPGNNGASTAALLATGDAVPWFLFTADRLVLLNAQRPAGANPDFDVRGAVVKHWRPAAR